MSTKNTQALRKYHQIDRSRSGLKAKVSAAGAAIDRPAKKTPRSHEPLDRDKVIQDFAPIIKFIAQKIAVRLPSHIQLDDLISAGVIGLLDAIEKFDSSRDNSFRTYAEFRIRGAMLDELRAQDWVPRSVRDKTKVLDKAIQALEAKLGRAPEDTEIAEHMQISVEELYDLMNEVRPVSLISIDESQGFNDSDKKSILNILEGSKKNSPLFQASIKTVKTVIARAIEKLPERQRLILSLYYYEDLNLREIGRILRISESRVSQLHAMAVLRLRTAVDRQITPEDLEPLSS
jgi:RNA polymerase sigma factor for flagellar operon FliA